MSRAVGHGVVIGLLVLLAGACASTGGPVPASPSRFVAEGRGDRLVVFVHGIGGDADATWRNPAGGVWWPDYRTRTCFTMRRVRPHDPGRTT